MKNDEKIVIRYVTRIEELGEDLMLHTDDPGWHEELQRIVGLAKLIKTTIKGGQNE